jgi:hypothetical protein
MVRRNPKKALCRARKGGFAASIGCALEAHTIQPEFLESVTPSGYTVNLKGQFHHV